MFFTGFIPKFVKRYCVFITTSCYPSAHILDLWLVKLFFMRKIIKYIRKNYVFKNRFLWGFFIIQIQISMQLLTFWIVMQNVTCIIAFLEAGALLLHHSPILCITPRDRTKELRKEMPFEPQSFCSTAKEHKTIQRMLEGTSGYCLIILPFLSQAIISGIAWKMLV